MRCSNLLYECHTHIFKYCSCRFNRDKVSIDQNTHQKFMIDRTTSTLRNSSWLSLIQLFTHYMNWEEACHMLQALSADLQCMQFSVFKRNSIIISASNLLVTRSTLLVMLVWCSLVSLKWSQYTIMFILVHGLWMENITNLTNQIAVDVGECVNHIILSFFRKPSSTLCCGENCHRKEQAYQHLQQNGWLLELNIPGKSPISKRKYEKIVCQDLPGKNLSSQLTHWELTLKLMES